MIIHRTLKLSLLGFASLALAVGQTSTGTSISASTPIQQEFLQIESLGSGALENLPSALPVPTLDRLSELKRWHLDDENAFTDGGSGTPAPPPLTYPTVRNNRFATQNEGFFGFDGLSHADQRFAGTGAYANSQFSTEPPDQGLCVANGYVVEAVNSALAVYRTSTGTRVVGPTAMNQFFGLRPSITRISPPIFGDSLSDPKCAYDSETNRFFVTILGFGVNPTTGNLTGASYLYIAVTKTGDPTGGWNLSRITTTGHGTSCPCFGDQPLIGLNEHGFFLSTNAFSLVTGRFVGTQLYAISKTALGAGTVPPILVRFILPAATLPDGSFPFSLQPATGLRNRIRRNSEGTEYFVSAYNITQQFNDKVVAWGLKGTAQLNSPPSASTFFSLDRVLAESQVYGVPPDTAQKRGTFPLGSQVDPKVIQWVSTNEHRMQQITYVNGHLWGAVTTGVSAEGEDGVKAGILWFSMEVVNEDDGFSSLQASVERQGYISAPNASVFFPAIAVNSSNTAVVGFTLVGPDFFPSTGYVRLAGDNKQIHVAGVGVNSQDGFTGYPSQYTQTPCDPAAADGTQICSSRWGDYGASAVDEDGNLWFSHEYIGPRPRSLFANWGTFVTMVTQSASGN